MEIVNLCTPGKWDLADSYGLIACQLARELAGMGIHVNGYALLDIGHAAPPEDIAGLLAQPRVPVPGAILLGYPTNYRRHGAMVAHGPRLAITMFESSKIPAGWAEVMNRCDAVVTPSRFCRDIFREAGVAVPVHVVPLGVSPIYRPATRPSNRPLTFLAFLDRGLRKGGLLAQQAFTAAFGDDPDYRLILKARAHVRGLDFINENITIIRQDMTEQELYELFLSADVMISPSTGEGFGLIPREFAATGGISLATNWSGTADDIDLWGVPLAYELVKADWRDTRNLRGQDLGEWAHVDRSYLAGVLRAVADNRAWYQRRALNHAADVARLYDWRRFAAGVLGIWREVSLEHSHRTIAA